MVVCQFYLKGDCRFGNQCRNEHPARNPTRMLCQYFLRGNCRFGQNCKFEHPAKDAGGLGTNYQSPFKQSGFSSGQDRSSSFSFKSNFNRDQNPFGVLSQQTSQPKQALENTDSSSSIEQIIHKDMEIWITSRQWPLSCYSFHKEEPCLPGLNDFSFEEVRLEAIIANANGTGMAYQQSLKDLLAKCNQRKLELKRMSSAQLHQEIKSAEIQAMSPTHSRIGTNSQSQSFGGPTQSAPLSSLGSFGVSAQPSGLFSIPSTGGQSQGVFGGNASSNQQSNNLFGSLSSTTSQPANGFANSQSVNKSTGLFGSVNKNSSLSSSTFGQSSQSNSTNLFTSPPSQVGGAIQHLGTTSVRAVPLDSNGIGKPSMKTLNTPQSSTLLNSKTCSLPSSSSSSNSQLISCSEEDLIAFRADSFVLGKIPECAPPPQFC